MNDHLEQLINKANNLKNKIKLKRKRYLDHTYLDMKLEALNVELRRYQIQYKMNYYEDVFGDCENSKRMWKNINRVLGN